MPSHHNKNNHDTLIDVVLSDAKCGVAACNLAAIQRETGIHSANIIERLIERADTSSLGLRALFPECCCAKEGRVMHDRESIREAVAAALVKKGVVPADRVFISQPWPKPAISWEHRKPLARRRELYRLRKAGK